MTEQTPNFENTIAAFDAANNSDPNKVEVDGTPRPKELLYAQRMSATLTSLYPQASEALKLAVRAQHIQRWTIPRADYPMDRSGYRHWRTDLKKFHAETAGKLMAECGYAQDMISCVGTLIRKEHLKSNSDAQALEDVACIVFLEHYFADFAKKHDEDKLISIVQKTWVKMSDKAHAAALELSLPESLGTIVEKALA